MESLENIFKMWEKDAEVNRLEPGKEIINIPMLHSKYLRELTEHRMASRKINFDLLKMRKTKFEYYSGKMPKEELEERGWEPFRYTLKSDIVAYIDSDKDIIRLQEKKYYHDETVMVLESIMKELHSRTFQLRDLIQWEKFVNGAG